MPAKKEMRIALTGGQAPLRYAFGGWAAPLHTTPQKQKKLSNESGVRRPRVWTEELNPLAIEQKGLNAEPMM